MTFSIGQKVETRTGKIGTVIRADTESDRTVDVQFGSQEFTIRVTKLVDARRAKKARNYRTPRYQ